ncbi:MAG TPA: type II toxin-antitoxin system VapC family toxin [Conexibacter sp.]|jgi:PIN domain nuclease of toxin-antitoxin system|nr:type II toxin-antitoxin system VapC family toxin [Conexibacter sp.]
MKVILDAWAVAALLNDEPAAGRVTTLLERNECWMSSINLGEAYYTSMRARGERLTAERIGVLQQVVRLDHPDWPLVRDAATIKARGGLSYADAVCVATARRHTAPLYTGDEEIIQLEDPGVEVVDLRSDR